MDDIFAINPTKDSSFALLLSAQHKGYQLFYCDTTQLYASKNTVYAQVCQIQVQDNLDNFVSVLTQQTQQITEFNLVLMRKDPPFDINYIYTTYLLDQAEKQGVLVANKPQSLRDFNEKLSILNFSNCIPNTLVSSQQSVLLGFLQAEKTMVIKPLDGMGGQDIFKLSSDNLDNAKQKITQLTQNNKRPIMAQQFLPDIAKGDKRILLINSKPIPYALNRIPPKDNWKGNLAQGAIGIAQPLTNRDKWLCDQIAPTLKAKGLFFVGLDVIGDYITEINITSPTGIRELDKQCDLDIANKLLTALENQLP